MNKVHQALNVRWLREIQEVDQGEWNKLAIPLKTPFLEWQWLRQIEVSGSASPTTGWLPRHLTLWSEGRLIAAAVLYVKLHSAGEFVFDHIWADVANKLGVTYYPKLVGMSPFTPMGGYRFLVDSGHDEEFLTQVMLKEIDRFCNQYSLSGCHFLFVDPMWSLQIESHGYKKWIHQRFVWENSAFKTFDEFLNIFKSNQRRNIKKERRSMQNQNIKIHVFNGQEIPFQYYSLMYRFYVHTNERYGPWSCKFLNEEAFKGIFREFRDRLLLIAAFSNDESVPKGMSLLVKKKDQLYGRYWGALESINHLHFNLCYYYPIEWSINNGVRTYDPGVGGIHKLRRGFRADAHYSLHLLYDKNLKSIMDANIGRINSIEQTQIEALNEELPFSEA